MNLLGILGATDRIKQIFVVSNHGTEFINRNNVFFTYYLLTTYLLVVLIELFTN